jgi:hypothetical protein
VKGLAKAGRGQVTFDSFFFLSLLSSIFASSLFASSLFASSLFASSLFASPPLLLSSSSFV